MTLNLPISPDLEVKLRETAAASGKDLAEFVLEVLQEKMLSAGAPIQANPNLSAEQWSAKWQAWGGSHRIVGHPVDDSRESIYAERGE